MPDGRRRYGDAEINYRMAEELAAFAPRLLAFDSAEFGVPAGSAPDAVRTRLAARALARAGVIVVPGLFEDVALLHTRFDCAAEAPGRMGVLGDLPAAFAHLYTHAFAERFLLVVADVAAALHRPEWQPPRSVAERLALHLIIDMARWNLDLAEVADWADSDEIYEPIRVASFADRDHERLYELDRSDLAEALRAGPDDGCMNVLAYWFRPPDPDAFVHPFVYP